VIVPPPAPSYTLAPGVGPLTLGQQSTLDACLMALTGRVAGTLLALERAAPRLPAAGELRRVGPADADA
jgi:hypothetical protein